MYGPVIIFYFPFGVILRVDLLVFGNGLFWVDVCVKNKRNTAQDEKGKKKPPDPVPKNQKRELPEKWRG